MFGLFKKKKCDNQPSKQAQETAALVLKETERFIHTLRLDFQHRFEELHQEIRELNQGLKHLENQLLVKDLKDKQQYGQLHYKLHEVRGKKMDV